MPRLRQYWQSTKRAVQKDGDRGMTTVYVDEFVIHDEYESLASPCGVGVSGSMIDAMHGSTLTTTTTTTL